MLSEKRILEEIEKTLQSFDKERVLEENPFLFTRIQAERENRLRRNRYRFTARMNLRYVGMLLLLLLNVMTVIYYEQHDKHDMRDRLVSELKADLQIDQSQNNF